MYRQNASTSMLSLTTLIMYQELFGNKKYGKCKFHVEKIKYSEHYVQTVGKINSMKIEVRSSEKPHNLPHFHVTAPGRIDAVYTISPLGFYKGDVSSKDNKTILKWAEENKDILVNMWNDFHGYRIKVS